MTQKARDSRPTRRPVADIEVDAEARARRLAAFTARVEQDDAEMIEYWRGRSAAEHARAGADLSDMAARISVQTGHGKDPHEMFPGLATFQRRRDKGRP